jgi:hypothetical protein
METSIQQAGAEEEKGSKSRSSSGDYELGSIFEETEENIFLSEEQ